MSKINLLPPEQKTIIEQSKKNAKTLNVLLKTSVFIFFVIAIYAASLFQLTKMLNAKNNEFKENQKLIADFGNLEEKSKKVSERLNIIRSIDASTPQWSSVIEEIQKTMPSGIYLTKVKMDVNTKERNKISGFAKGKKEVAALRDLMEKSEKFEYVDIESSSTVVEPKTKKEVESFSISFSLEKEALNE